MIFSILASLEDRESILTERDALVTMSDDPVPAHREPP